MSDGPKWQREIPGRDALARLALGRLPHLDGARGRAAAPLVWMALASHLRWGSNRRLVSVGNETLARETGLPVRAVEYAVAYLKRIGRVTARYRRVSKYKTTRTIRLEYPPGPAPRVVLPKPAEVRAIWDRVRAHRERPTATVSLAFAAHVFAMCEHRKIGRSKTCETTVGELASFVGVRRGGTFNARLAVLAAAGLLARRGLSWAGGFLIMGRLAITRIIERMREPAPSLPAPARLVRLEAERLLAAMSEAFARCDYG